MATNGPTVLTAAAEEQGRNNENEG